MADGVTAQAAFAQSDTTFVFQPIGGTLTFVTDANGVTTGFILTIVEGDLPAKKIN